MSKLRLLAVVSLILLITVPATSQDIGFYRLAPKAGLIFPKDLDLGFMFGAAADLGELTDNLKLIPLLSYWTASRSESGLETSLSNFQIGGDVQYYIENVEGLYFGGGLSINFATFSAEYTFLGETYSGDESKTKVGFGLLGGYEIPIGKNTGFVQAKYNIISDINTFEINLGMWFDMN